MHVIITGTPGTGKTSTADAVAQQSGFTHVDLSTLVKEKELYDGRDEELDCFIIDEDKICDELEESMTSGGMVVDYHGCDFFPERWFDLVIVLRTDNSTLFTRLENRGYSKKKISENVECEIMQVILDEANESYRQDIIKQLPSNTVQDMESNVNMICTWISQFKTSAT